jgi:hypothetical protein
MNDVNSVWVLNCLCTIKEPSGTEIYIRFIHLAPMKLGVLVLFSREWTVD